MRGKRRKGTRLVAKRGALRQCRLTTTAVSAHPDCRSSCGAPKVDDGPCTTYCGPLGAGNYVKMVHNGIEYGDMQLIAEIYDILKVGRAKARTTFCHSTHHVIVVQQLARGFRVFFLFAGALQLLFVAHPCCR